MQSQGSTSSQPSFDSMSSSDSLLYSDSEQAEDETDVFLTDSSPSVIIGGVGGAMANGVSESSGSRWTCHGFTRKEEEDESYRSESGSKSTDSSTGETEPTGPIPKSQGDLLFAQKCAELQGFVRPLLELLNGLKRGRFDRGLSSFQQSVAMDRIQRIVGVLQRPDSGEKYLNTLLQVEMMLKLWFPQISTQPVSAASSIATSPSHSHQDTSGSTPPHKHRDQLHIPVKKRRLSWTGTDSPAHSPVPLKCPHMGAGDKVVKTNSNKRDSPPSSPSLPSDGNQNSPVVASNSQLNDATQGQGNDSKEPDNLSKYKAGQCSEPSLTWVHVAPILSPGKACLSHEGVPVAGSTENILTTSRRASPATQDSSVSSTTPYKHPKSLKKSIRCQSQPAAGQQSETTEACQGQCQSPPVAPKPSPEPCPATLET
ncbi:uncharacterized protein KZ484_026503 [Pholidichthys leucotaenia]